MIDAAPDSVRASSGDWYYEKNGKRIGPVPDDVIKEQFSRGTINLDTLVWKNAFGTEWRPLRATEFAPQNTEPPPLPASRVNGVFGWILAVLPLLGAGLERIITDATNTSISSSQVFWGYVIANSILSLIDAQSIEKSGRNTRNIHLWLWAVLFVPVYLIQRSRALGQFPLPFLTWIACFIVSALITNPELLQGNVHWGTGLPECDSAFETSQVQKIFADIPLMRITSITAVKVSSQIEDSTTEQSRKCHATVLASNAKEYSVRYTIEKTKENKFYTTLNILP